MHDASGDLDKIVLRNAAILNIDADLDVSDIETDVTSLVYVGGSRTLQIGNLFDGNKFVAETGTLQPAVDSDVTLGMWSFITGTLDVPVSTTTATSPLQMFVTRIHSVVKLFSLRLKKNVKSKK